MTYDLIYINHSTRQLPNRIMYSFQHYYPHYHYRCVKNKLHDSYQNRGRCLSPFITYGKCHRVPPSAIRHFAVSNLISGYVNYIVSALGPPSRVITIPPRVVSRGLARTSRLAVESARRTRGRSRQDTADGANTSLVSSWPPQSTR